MPTTFQLVDDNLSTVLFDFESLTGAGNPSSLPTAFASGGGLAFQVEPELTVLSPSSAAGGRVVSRRDPLAVASWRQIIRGTSSATYMDAVGELARLLAKGGTLKWIMNGSTETRYIDFEPSGSPAILDGRRMGLLQIAELFYQPEGVELRLLCQPYLRGASLLPAVNLLTNSTLLIDVASPANRPDDWTWDVTTGITAEVIYVADPSFSFDISTAATRNLQQVSVPTITVVGFSWAFSFEAKSYGGAFARVRAVVEFLSAADAVLGTTLGTLTTLTTAWAPISVITSAAPTSSVKVRVSFRFENVDASLAGVRLRRAQLERNNVVTLYRTGTEVVSFDPAATANPTRIPVFAQGNAPCLARCSFTSDANGLGRVRVYRESLLPVDLLKATLFKQLESGTLGAATTNVAVADSSAANAARWTPAPVNPSLLADFGVGGTGQIITLTKPAGLVEGKTIVAVILRTDHTTVIQPPPGAWKYLGGLVNSAATFAGVTCVAMVWLKVADAADVAATSFVFTVQADAAGQRSYRGWIGAFSDIDPNNPLDTIKFATKNNNATPTAPDITTSKNNNMVITIFAGIGAAGALTFSTPIGTTPTYTEQDDGTTDQTFRGMSVNTGVLATAAATGTKDSTAAFAIDAVTINMALNIAPAALAARSTVTFTALPARDYEVRLRHLMSAAGRMRVRVEWAPMASPTVWNALPDFIFDTTGASAFTYSTHGFGRLNIPEDFTFATLTVRVSVGLETTPTGSPLWNGDFLRLVPANEQIGEVISPTLLTTGEFLVGDAALDRALHLDSSSQIKEVATVAGPVPIELQPGLNLLDFDFAQAVATGYIDRAGVLGTDPTVAVTLSPSYRT